MAKKEKNIDEIVAEEEAKVVAEEPTKVVVDKAVIKPTKPLSEVAQDKYYDNEMNMTKLINDYKASSKKFVEECKKYETRKLILQKEVNDNGGELTIPYQKSSKDGAIICKQRGKMKLLESKAEDILKV